jgi:ADP-ribose pyrophosphatase YjhB (NUDIX family)
MTVATNANIVAIENNKALMVLERNPKNTGMLFGFPGGSRKSGEHPLITALREWYEETGIPIHDFTGVDILYNLKGGKTQTADIICLIYVKNFATNPHGDHTSLHREMMSLTYIKQSKDSVWFQIVEKKLSLYDANRPEDKFRIRQCTYHEFDEVMRRATTLQNNISV